MVTTEPDYEMEAAPKSFIERWGLGLALGGGVEGFTEDSETGTDPGGNWTVRATLGTKQYIAFEGSYIGSAQSIDALGLDTNAILVGNGIQGAVRLNLLTGYRIDPFVFGGVAWRHYDLTNQAFNTSAVNGSDDVAELPLGVGVQYATAGVLLDARGEYRFASEGNMFDRPGFNQNMDRWGVQGNIGYEF